MQQQVTLTRQAVRTPRAAAVAGIIFSVLFTTSMVLIRLALPCPGVATVGEQQPHALVGTGLSGVGVCDQCLHPDHQSAW